MINTLESGQNLLISYEAPPAVLPSALGSTGQKRHGPVGAAPEESHNNDQRAEAALLYRQAGRVGAVQPREEKAPQCPCRLSVLKGAYK